jgi:micrococcal nuclease
MLKGRGRLLLLITGFAMALSAQPAAAATCSDYSTQAEAQRAADTRDADGDGIYCESLPCPCLRPGQSSTPPPRPTPAPRPTPRPRPRAQRRARVFRQVRITSVADGDTIRVRLGNGRFETVRLIGIDTPETKDPGKPVECGGLRATDRMLRLSFTAPIDRDGDGLLDDEGGEGRTVTLRTDPTQDTRDRFGRLLAYVTTTSGRNLAREQPRAGWAKVFVFDRNFQQLSRFRSAERQARGARRGAWRLCGGNFHTPAR